jgi:hypothetical protein
MLARTEDKVPSKCGMNPKVVWTQLNMVRVTKESNCMNPTKSKCYSFESRLLPRFNQDVDSPMLHCDLAMPSP